MEIKRMEVKYKKLDEITPYKNNPRKNDAAVDKVAESIKNFGFKVPIIIDKNNEIICGHTRYKASRKLGLEEIPVIYADDLTEEQIKAFRLADNKVSELAEWDLDMLQIELSELEEISEIDMSAFGFEDILEQLEEKEVVEDNFNEELPEEAVSKLGDIYQLGNHRLMVGDSTSESDVQKLLNGETMDMVMTDPPYNIDVSNSKGMKIKNDNLENDEFLEFLTKAFSNLAQSLKAGGAFYIWLASKEWMNFETALKRSGLTIRQELIWNKNAFTMGRQDYQWKHEPCMYGWKDGAAHYFIDDRRQSTVIEDKPADIKKMKKDELVKLLEEIYSDKNSTTIINENKPTVNDLHPTMKPLKLLGRLIKNSSREGENVLDLFGGSGSTLITCEQIDRNCYMMEYDPIYADVIIKRWEDFTGKKAEKIEGKEEKNTEE